MRQLNTEKMAITEAKHMPIVKAHAEKIGLVETINQMVGSQMELIPGIAVLAMVLDTLSGRTPLYRLAEFFEEKDTEPLLGTPIDSEQFCDYNLGRLISLMATAREEAGCFVLLTNLVDRQDDWPAHELLALYKRRNGVEQNFSFIKDPVIVNSIFLKKAQRIEVLGMVLLISLLILRLMERSMRQYVENNDGTLPGWVRGQTKKPTTFMMTTKFSSALVIAMGPHRQLVKPLKPVQLEYLKALDVTTDAFTAP